MDLMLEIMRAALGASLLGLIFLAIGGVNDIRRRLRHRKWHRDHESGADKEKPFKGTEEDYYRQAHEHWHGWVDQNETLEDIMNK